MHVTIFWAKNHKPIYSYTGGRSVACLAPWHAYVRRAERIIPEEMSSVKPNWHELDTEGLLAWCGNIHVMLQPTGDRLARVPMKVVTSCDKLRYEYHDPQIAEWDFPNVAMHWNLRIEAS